MTRSIDHAIGNGITVTAPFYWSRIKGDKTGKGIRISEGRGFVWIADHEVLELANTLADYLAQERTK